jgi:uncharacterized protein (DUF1697 family)
MTTYISLIRGINVSGQKKILMPELKALYEGLGFSRVMTYIQSGNVIFSTDINTPVPLLSSRIEKAISDKYGFNIPVIIRTIEEIKAILAANPFIKSSEQVIEKYYVTFLEEKPLKADIEKINPFNFLPDKFFIVEREIYLNCASGYGTTKLSNTFFENKFKVKATTRNWNTVNKLLELAKGI